jgi:hypothetical protein
MAQEWLTKYLRMKPEVETIFEELEEYREFCVDYGFVYNEAHLHNERSPWNDFRKLKSKGWKPRDHWGHAISVGRYGPREERKNWKPRSEWKPRSQTQGR